MSQQPASVSRSNASVSGYRGWYTHIRSAKNPAQVAVAVHIERGGKNTTLRGVLSVNPAGDFEIEAKACAWALSKVSDKKAPVTLHTENGELSFSVEAAKDDNLDLAEETADGEIVDFFKTMQTHEEFAVRWATNNQQKYDLARRAAQSALDLANL